MLLPQNYQPPKDLAPTPGTVVGPNGNLVAVGPPLINPNPNLTDPNPLCHHGSPRTTGAGHCRSRGRLAITGARGSLPAEAPGGSR